MIDWQWCEEHGWYDPANPAEDHAPCATRQERRRAREQVQRDQDERSGQFWMGYL